MSDLSSVPPESWPYLTGDLPGVGGLLKSEPGDFEVEELPAYFPSGAGEHLFLWIEKEDVAAEQLQRHIARGLGIGPGDVGMAGLKDRHGITRQFVSVPSRLADKVDALATPQIRILSAAKHGNKLRPGHLRGNRFSILLRDVADDSAQRAAAIADRVQTEGFPNYFGMQRFGADRDNVEQGLALLRGTKLPGSLPPSRRKFLLRLLLSSVQSALFNEALAGRICDGALHRVLTGDVMQVVASGGLFVTSDAAVEQERFERREIVPSGPLFGPKMKVPEGRVAEVEAALLTRFELNESHFTRFAQLTSGTRRPYLILPLDLEVVADTAGLRFRFSLPPGTYATVLLREFQKGTDAPAAP